MVYDTAQQQSLLQNLSSPYANKIERMEKGAVQSSSPQAIRKSQRNASRQQLQQHQEQQKPEQSQQSPPEQLQQQQVQVELLQPAPHVQDPLSAGLAVGSSSSTTPSASPTVPFAIPIHESERLQRELVQFIETCPLNWEQGQYVKKFQLFDESISCVLWEDRFYITGTDIVKSVIWRFRLDGHSIVDKKKFEEGVFSDLRNLKPGIDATLEEPRSPFLDFLYKLHCIRTHKKQKVFFWYSVPHEKIYQDALRRERKREIFPIVDTLLSLNTTSDELVVQQQQQLQHHQLQQQQLHHQQHFQMQQQMQHMQQMQMYMQHPQLQLQYFMHLQQQQQQQQQQFQQYQLETMRKRAKVEASV